MEAVSAHPLPLTGCSSRLTVLLRLIRVRLTLLNGISALSGYLLFTPGSGFWTACAAFGGVALLAAGASILNQVLEVDLDCRMERTSVRPLPAGQMTPSCATTIAIGLLTLGLLLLRYVGGFQPALLGMATLVWYLLVYTPLKRRTSLALPVGALCGAMPPLIGWCLAGGQAGDYRIMLLAGLLYLWQIPHFWLLLQRHAEEYRSAGIPVFPGHWSDAHRMLLLRLWIVALVAGAMLLPLTGMISRPVSFWYAAFPLPLAGLAYLRHESALFYVLNLFPVLLAVVFLIQKMA